MIIDLILDRKDGEPYKPVDFYHGCFRYGAISNDITRALDAGTEMQVKQAICKYIKDNCYNLDICKYVNRQKWL